MAKQIAIYYNTEDYIDLLDFISEVGGVVVTSDGEIVYPASYKHREWVKAQLSTNGKNVYIVCSDFYCANNKTLHIESIKMAEAIEFSPCHPQPQSVPDRAEIYSRLNVEFPGCIFMGCILANTLEIDRRLHELMSEVSMMPNPYYFNGTEAGRMYFEPCFQSEEGKLRKSEAICRIYSKLERFIKRHYVASVNNYAYIAPHAYSDYKSGSFIPCQGNNRVDFI